MDYNLRPIWDEILEIYKAFAAVCDKNGLRYYVTGGTLLGAARHKGFIPWDDDFEELLQIVENGGLTTAVFYVCGSVSAWC